MMVTYTLPTSTDKHLHTCLLCKMSTSYMETVNIHSQLSNDGQDFENTVHISRSTLFLSMEI